MSRGILLQLATEGYPGTCVPGHCLSALQAALSSWSRLLGTIATGPERRAALRVEFKHLAESAYEVVESLARFGRGCHAL